MTISADHIVFILLCLNAVGLIVIALVQYTHQRWVNREFNSHRRLLVPLTREAFSDQWKTKLFRG